VFEDSVEIEADMGGLSVHRVESVVGHENDVDVGPRRRQQLSESAIDELVLASDEFPFRFELIGRSGRERHRLEGFPMKMAGDVDATEVEQDQIVVFGGRVDREAAENAIRFEHRGRRATFLLGAKPRQLAVEVVQMLGWPDPVRDFVDGAVRDDGSVDLFDRPRCPPTQHSDPAAGCGHHVPEGGNPAQGRRNGLVTFDGRHHELGDAVDVRHHPGRDRGPDHRRGVVKRLERCRDATISEAPEVRKSILFPHPLDDIPVGTVDAEEDEGVDSR